MTASHQVSSKAFGRVHAPRNPNAANAPGLGALLSQPFRRVPLDTMALALEVARRHEVGVLDLTGGSPEMNPHFRWLVGEARHAGLHVMDRLKPTIMEESGFEWVGEFLAEHRVEIVASLSLPCYSKAHVDKQRG